MAGLNGSRPQLGFLFASSAHDLSSAIAAARQEAGGAEILACTTAGEITERGLQRNGMSVFLLSSDEMVFESRIAEGLKSDYLKAARTLCDGFNDAATRARGKGYGYSTTVTLIDGLAGVGEKLVADIVNGTYASQQVVGGAAGDDGAFKATHVGSSARSGTDTAVALHAFGAKPWGVGVGHGLQPSSAKRMKVTRATGNVIHEISTASRRSRRIASTRSREGFRSSRRRPGNTSSGTSSGSSWAAKSIARGRRSRSATTDR